MPLPRLIHFPPFRLDLDDERLWHGDEPLQLTHKAFAVLRALLASPGQLVTRDALFAAVWANTTVSEAALTACIRELRRVLQDTVPTPRYIETIRGRGYRFVATLTEPSPVVPPASARLLPPPPVPPADVVGRETEFAQLYHCLAQAWEGTRQVVFVTGEAGIGKTTLVEAFLTGVATPSNLWIGRGQCIAPYGEGEAYLPVLEALGRLGRESGNASLLQVLDRYAPTWLAQMPALVAPQEWPTLLQRIYGATPQRMLREMAEALEVLTAERMLILWLEDLQWSDVSTLQLLAGLALRPGPARLLILGTCRPVEPEQPLARIVYELHMKGGGQECPLHSLSEPAVATYLGHRWTGVVSTILSPLVHAIYHRTEGHPLFLVQVVRYLDEQGWRDSGGAQEAQGTLEKLLRDIPRDIDRMIETHVACCTAGEQRVLEVASVVGVEFSTAAVAAGGELTIEGVEDICAALARRGAFLQEQGVVSWPDTTVGTGYRFVHALYQDVLYHRVPGRQRIVMHQRIGLRYEQAYGGHAAGIASELAVHFTQGRDFHRAIVYHQQAAETALRRSAYQEARSHLAQGLTLLETLPDTPERLEVELALQIILGVVLMTTKGYAASEVAQAYGRARALYHQVEEHPRHFQVLHGLWFYYHIRGDLRTAEALGTELLALARQAQDAHLLLEALMTRGATTLFHRVELPAASEYLAEGVALYEPLQHRSHTLIYGQDPKSMGLIYASFAAWLLGYPECAVTRSQEALACAQDMGHPFNLVCTLSLAAVLHHLRREPQTVHERIKAALSLATEHGFSQWMAHGMLLQGWVLTAQGQETAGLLQMRHGLEAWQATGAGFARPYYLALLAEASATVGQLTEALRLLDEALDVVDTNGEYWYAAEIHRLRGELLLRQSAPEEEQGQVCFQQALTVAQQQQAKSLELRAAMSLSRLWQQQGRCAEGYDLLASVYGWFTEGFDTADLQIAKALLAEIRESMENRR